MRVFWGGRVKTHKEKERDNMHEREKRECERTERTEKRGMREAKNKDVQRDIKFTRAHIHRSGPQKEKGHNSGIRLPDG